MSEHPTCKVCSYWHKPDGRSWPVPDFGACGKIAHASEVTEWADEEGELEDVLKPEYANDTAFAADGSGYHAELLTKATFYCPMHSALADKPVASE